jgi:hypothetical protein
MEYVNDARLKDKHKDKQDKYGLKVLFSDTLSPF